MFGSVKYGVNAYAKVGVETGVASASPHKLIAMLFEGALVAITNAKQHMANGHIAEKGQSISKAILIVESGLRASLNKEAGGEIATNLDALYEYISGRLLQANLHNQVELLEESYRLLLDLKTAWEAIAEKQPSAEVSSEKPSADFQQTAYDPLMPRTTRFARA
ncbi:MAG: flagellar export chaperone FliS [Oxalobacter sp.]|nr:MAG: flagellar export chaperone FliS [Oxalobacter sp.]